MRIFSKGKLNKLDCESRAPSRGAVAKMWVIMSVPSEAEDLKAVGTNVKFPAARGRHFDFADCPKVALSK